LVEYCGYLPNDESNKKYPMGPEAQGIIMYTPDGYMSAQLLTPGQKRFDHPEVKEYPRSGSTEDWAQVGKNYVGYTGQFYLDEAGDESGPMLMHHMRTSSLPSLLGDTQRRLVKIEDRADGRYLVLSLGSPVEVFGEPRMVRVTWKRMNDNQATSPPNASK